MVAPVGRAGGQLFDLPGWQAGVLLGALPARVQARLAWDGRGGRGGHAHVALKGGLNGGRARLIDGAGARCRVQCEFGEVGELAGILPLQDRQGQAAEQAGGQ